MSGKWLLRREAALQQAAAATPQGTHCSGLLLLRWVCWRDSSSPSPLCPLPQGNPPATEHCPSRVPTQHLEWMWGSRAALEHQRSEGDPGAVGMGTSAHPQAAGRGRDVCSSHARCPAAAHSQHRGLRSNGCDRGKHKKWLNSCWAEKEVSHLGTSSCWAGNGTRRQEEEKPWARRYSIAQQWGGPVDKSALGCLGPGRRPRRPVLGEGGTTTARSFSTQGCLSPWAESPHQVGTGEGWQPLALLSSTCTMNAVGQRDLGVQAGSSNPDTVIASFSTAQKQLEAKQRPDRLCICFGRGSGMQC